MRKLAHLITTDHGGAYLLTDDGKEAVRIIQSLRSEGSPTGSPSSRVRRALWPKATLIVIVALFVAFVAIPTGLSISIGPDGTYRPLIGLFIERIDKQLLPAGWTLISSGGISDPLEIYLAAAMTLALLFASPLVALKGIRFLGPALLTRNKMTYWLVAVASVLLAVGALFGYFVLSGAVISSMAPNFGRVVAPPPLIDATSFYLSVLGTVALGAIAFSLPVYIYVRVRFGTRLAVQS